MKKVQKKTIPAYADVASQEWVELSTALRLLAGPGAQWKGDLGPLRARVEYAIKKGELEVIKVRGKRYTPTRHVRPVPFFQWASNKWPDSCACLNVPLNVSMKAVVNLSQSVHSHVTDDGPEDIATLRQLYIEKQRVNFHLCNIITELHKRIEVLEPDAEKYRAQVSRGKSTGGKRGSW